MFVLKFKHDLEIRNLQYQIDALKEEMKGKATSDDLEFVINEGTPEFTGWSFKLKGRKTCGMQEAIGLIAEHVGATFDVLPESPARAVVKGRKCTK